MPWYLDDFDGKPEVEPHHPHGHETIGESIRLARCECRECKESAVAHDVHTMRFSDYHIIDPNEVEIGDMTPHKYLLMTSHMFAFNLQDRAYGKPSLACPTSRLT